MQHDRHSRWFPKVAPCGLGSLVSESSLALPDLLVSSTTRVNMSLLLSWLEVKGTRRGRDGGFSFYWTARRYAALRRRVKCRMVQSTWRSPSTGDLENRSLLPMLSDHGVSKTARLP